MAVPVGWEVVVAYVGDSLAFLDTGSEVVQVLFVPSFDYLSQYW